MSGIRTEVIKITSIKIQGHYHFFRTHTGLYKRNCKKTQKATEADVLNMKNLSDVFIIITIIRINLHEI